MSASSFKPLISVILPVNKDDNYLQNAIKSVLTQSIQDIELLIIINGPNKNKIFCKLKSIYRFEVRVRLFTTDFESINFNLNYGIHMAKSEYVARMDSDDISEICRLEYQFEFLQKYSDVGICGSNYFLIDSNDLKIGEVKLPEDNLQIRKQLKYKNPVCHPSVMYRKSLVTSVGGYFGGSVSEDYDLWNRIANKKDIKFYNIQKCLLSYRIIGSGIARRNPAAYYGMVSTGVYSLLTTLDIGYLPGIGINLIKGLMRSIDNNHKT